MILKMYCYLNTELKINTLILRIFKLVHCFEIQLFRRYAINLLYKFMLNVLVIKKFLIQQNLITCF